MTVSATFYVVKSFLCGYNKTQGGIELKKFIILLLIAMLALGPLTACGNNTSNVSKVKVSFKDIATNKIYDTVIYPDALEHN